LDLVQDEGNNGFFCTIPNCDEPGTVCPFDGTCVTGISNLEGVSSACIPVDVAISFHTNCSTREGCGNGLVCEEVIAFGSGSVIGTLCSQVVAPDPPCEPTECEATGEVCHSMYVSTNPELATSFCDSSQELLELISIYTHSQLS
jgi:hypothetical protein